MVAAVFALCGMHHERVLAVVNIRSKFFVAALHDEDQGRVEFPLPLDYRGQVPAGFQLIVSRPSAIVGRRVTEKKTGDQVVELDLAPMKQGSKFDVEWRSQVIVDVGESFSFSQGQKFPFPAAFPQEVREWLKPSRFVQSDDPAIVGRAGPAKRDDVLETIQAVNILQNTIISKTQGQLTELSSVSALTKRGSCTSNANLMAALLRANGVPARLLSGYPVWSGPLQTHYIVEAFIPEYGWYPVESTLNAAGWPCSEMPIVSIVSRENEELGGRRLSGAAGVPYLSLTETSGKIFARGTLNNSACDHEAKSDPKAVVPAGSWEPAKARWHAWLSKCRETLADLPNLVGK